MRTSRIARDTSRILDASRTQRTLRQTRSAANAAVKDIQRSSVKAHGSPENSENHLSDSELSSVPSSSGSDGEGPTTGKKRKRGTNAPVVAKHESKEISVAAVPSPKKELKPKRARRAPVKKIRAENGDIKIEPPANWEEVYTLTRQMRNENLAPVDTMGCESLAERSRTPRDQRFQTLIALMLSSQTKDTVTAVAMRGMQDNMPGVCP